MPDYDKGYAEEVVDFHDAFASEEEVTSPEYPAEGIYHCLLVNVNSSGERFPGAVFLLF